MFKLIQKRNFITIINQAETAYRQFLGMNRIKLDSGIRLKIPFLHQIERVDMRERCLPIENLNGFTADNVPVSVSGALFFRVVDAEKACFSVKNYFQAVANIGESSSRSILGKFTYDSIISKRNELNSELMRTIGSSIECWGIACNRFEITNFKPQNEHVARHLEKQMEAERARRENELNTLAKVRSAEGDRDSIKLKADANFYQTKIEADSKAYTTEQNAIALAKQFEILKKVTDVEDKNVMEFVLEMERQKNLNAIANSGKGDKIYFINPNHMFPMQRHVNI